MRKHQKEYRQFQAEIGLDAFKRPLLTHRNAITTGWKRVGRVSRDNTRARESILEEDLAKNVEPGVEGEELTDSSEEIARAKGVDAIL